MIPIRWLFYIAAAITLYWPARNGPPLYDDGDVFGPRDWSIITLRKWQWCRWRPLSWVIWKHQQYRDVRKWGHHQINAVLHGINAILVERLAVALDYSTTSAIIAALIFAAHPLAVNAVGYMSARASILGATFGIIAILFAIQGAWWAVAAAVFLGVNFKEDAIVYVPCAILISWYMGHSRDALILLMMCGAVASFLWKRRLEVTDAGIREIGLAGAHPPLKHAWVTLKHTALLFPRWIFGISSSPWHGDGLR